VLQNLHAPLGEWLVRGNWENWHALRNESGTPAGYLNVIDQLYDHENPDNWRLPKDCAGVPDIL